MYCQYLGGWLRIEKLLPSICSEAYVQQLESSTIKLTHLERELKQAHEQVRRNHHTVVTLQTLRPTLLYDTVCTITDMQFAAYHGVVHIGQMEAYQLHF
ncbi:ACT domain-containing protein [Tanacetum coccineum]